MPRCALVAMSLMAALALTPGVFSSSSMVPPTASWMARIRNDTPVHELVLPGTHDSCARQSAVTLGDHWVLAQSMALTEQLAHGIRYLDMRVGLCQDTTDKLCMYHGAYYLKMNFDDAIEAMGEFLARHPTEGLVMRLKIEQDKGIDDFAALVEASYLRKTPGRWLVRAGAHRKATDVRMEDLRGKIVIFWNTDTLTSRFGFSYEDIAYRRSWEFQSYDALVEGFRDRAARSASAEVAAGGWYENPTSGLVYPMGKSPIFEPLLKGIQETARAVLPRAMAALKTTTPMFKGIVSMDYPTEEMINLLIELSVSRHGVK